MNARLTVAIAASAGAAACIVVTFPALADFAFGIGILSGFVGVTLTSGWWMK